MKAIIRPSVIGGTISAPSSKSYTHRAIILASLASGKSSIHNPLISEDTRHTIAACQRLGVNIKLKYKTLEIIGLGDRFPRFNHTVKLFCGLSGTTIRLMTAVAAVSPNEFILKGEKRLNERPIGDLVNALIKQGISIMAKDNQFPPVKVQGASLHGGKINISGKISSQFVSALLLISTFAKKDTEIIVEDLHSAPYIDITIDLMKTFGVTVKKQNHHFFVKAGRGYKALDYTVEGDFSSASYFLSAKAITRSNISLTSLNPNSVQGDKSFMDFLKRLKNGSSFFDMGNFPDLVPPLSVVAAFHKGQTTISNIGHLRTKESDRIEVLSQELKKMGANIHVEKDCLIIVGSKLHGAKIDTHNDHRIAMSLAIAGLKAIGSTIISDAEVVNKSYPDFWNDLKKIGANVELI